MLTRIHNHKFTGYALFIIILTIGAGIGLLTYSGSAKAWGEREYIMEESAVIEKESVRFYIGEDAFVIEIGTSEQFNSAIVVRDSQGRKWRGLVKSQVLIGSRVRFTGVDKNGIPIFFRVKM